MAAASSQQSTETDSGSHLHVVSCIIVFSYDVALTAQVRGYIVLPGPHDDSMTVLGLFKSSTVSCVHILCVPGKDDLFSRMSHNKVWFH